MGPEAMHKHVRTHREARSTKTHSDRIYPESQTHDNAQTPLKAYTRKRKPQAGSGTYRYKEMHVHTDLHTDTFTQR